MNLTGKYLFRGRLQLETALHIGSGQQTVAATDSQVLRNSDGEPYIPGSSLKGTLRSQIERLCLQLPDLNDPQVCLTGQNSNSSCPTANQKETNKSDESRRSAFDNVCIICHLFGSPYNASRIFFKDAAVTEWAGRTAIRNGVVINRDSETAVNGLLYDYETVDSGSSFEFEMTVESNDDYDLGAACVGISELVNGNIQIGGMRSRGLGWCKLTDLKIYEADFSSDDPEERITALKKYLTASSGTGKTDGMSPVENVEQFLNSRIEKLFQ